MLMVTNIKLYQKTWGRMAVPGLTFPILLHPLALLSYLIILPVSFGNYLHVFKYCIYITWSIDFKHYALGCSYDEDETLTFIRFPSSLLHLFSIVIWPSLVRSVIYIYNIIALIFFSCRTNYDSIIIFFSWHSFPSSSHPTPWVSVSSLPPSLISSLLPSIIFDNLNCFYLIS